MTLEEIEILRQQNADNETAFRRAEAEYYAARRTTAEKLGQHLKTLREGSGLNTSNMARMIGASSVRTYCSQLEGGILNPDGTRRYYSVETLLEAIPQYESAIRAVEGMAEAHIKAISNYTHNKTKQP